MTLDGFFPEIVEHWREAGVEVRPAAGTASSITGSEVLPALTRRPHPRNVLATGQVRDWVRRRGIDVVLTNTATASAVSRAAPVGCPVVYFCHGLHWNNKAGPTSLFWRATENLLLRRTAGVVTINSDDEAWFARHAPGVPRTRLTAGVGLDIKTFARTELPRTEVPQLAWVGEYTRRKRPLEAVRVAEILVRRGHDFRLHMLGDGALRPEVEAEVRRRGLGSHVLVHGQVRVAEVLPSVHGVIHTASWEGLPRVLLEAAAVGRHIVAYDVKGVRDIPGARLVPDLDAEGLAEQLQSIDLTAPDPDLVDPDQLSSVHASDQIRVFLEDVLAGRV